MKIDITLVLLLIAAIANGVLLTSILKSKSKKQIKKIFSFNLICLLICTIGQITQILFSQKLGIKPIYFDYFVYIGTCFLPISVYFTGLSFENTKIQFKKKYIVLFIIPIISLLILWTNDYHHLFYKQYSTSIADTVYGPYMVIHNIYSYILLGLGIIYMLKFSIKNSGFFSKQSLLIVLGVSVPVIVNILGTFKIIPMSIYVTPITFTITIICCAIAIFKFQFLNVTPIALQKIVDRISDGYVVLDDNNVITDFNKTFLDIFKLSSDDIRSKNFIRFLQQRKISDQVVEKISKSIKKSKFYRNNSII